MLPCYQITSVVSLFLKAFFTFKPQSEIQIILGSTFEPKNLVFLVLRHLNKNYNRNGSV